MSEFTASSVLVTLNAPPALEEGIVDWLLEREEAPGFTSCSVHGHGTHHEDLSVAEQVSGRQRRVEFRVEVETAMLEGFSAALTEDFAGADLYFFVVPVLRSRHLLEARAPRPTSAAERSDGGQSGRQ
jgi:hypothetical protein